MSWLKPVPGGPLLSTEEKFDEVAKLATDAASERESSRKSSRALPGARFFYEVPKSASCLLALFPAIVAISSVYLNF